MTDRQPEGIVHEATDRIRETVDEIKPKLRGWLHAVLQRAWRAGGAGNFALGPGRA